MKIFFLCIMCIAVTAVVMIFAQRYRTKRMLNNLSRMLDEAICGDFKESHFDESLLSAVETKLAHFLSAAIVSSQNVQNEKNKIKTLISDISHQTKTPIANVLLYSQLLAERDLPSDCRELAAATENQAQKLKALIDSLVKMSRLESGILTLCPKLLPLSPMLSEAIEQALPTAKLKDISIESIPTKSTALFDKKWTEEAVFNLLDNAVKYTQSGGKITVSATDLEMFCRIDVTDTGQGIAESEQAKIFGRFYRSSLTTEIEGVGIGLYLVRQIAEGQGGYVKVSSKIGKGSTFSLFLPKV